MYQTGDTIKSILDQITRRDLVLPAIQREFVWRPEQICRLFDSLMQGYPFGTFLYWRITAENSAKFNYYDFVINYHQRDSPHCPRLPPINDRSITAVLDGQQRLTALNIGLRGTMAWKVPYRWWNNPSAFPVRHLYLDLLWNPEDDSDLFYRFDFLTDEQLSSSDDNECWFLVSDIVTMDDGPPMVKWINQKLPQHHVDQAYGALHRLYRVVHMEPVVAFYDERNQDLEKVLQIFIRMNSGGTILSYSDLLLSIAVAQWDKHDAREEIHSLVDELNRIGDGFSFSKDLVLKAGLMLSDIGNVGFKVTNFNKENMSIFEDKWGHVKHTLILTVRLISSFGFTAHSLRAQNAILPIAYYLFTENCVESYLTHSQFEQDRRAVREWLVRSLLKTSGIWGSGLDTLLTALRTTIKENDNGTFPVSQIRETMARRGKSLVFEDEELDDLADTQYGDGLTFALLALLFPFVDLRNQFHVDHIFPVDAFSLRELRNAEIPDGRIDWYLSHKDRLANLQLLEGPINNEKRAKMPAQWLLQHLPEECSRQRYNDLHSLGSVPSTIAGFEEFHNRRRALLREKILQLLGRYTD